MSDVIVTNGQPKAADIPLSSSLYESAYRAGKSLTAYLDEIDPESRYGDGLDGFQRQMMLAGINPVSDPVRGVWADEVSTFRDPSKHEKSGAEMLLPEFIARAWRRVSYRPSNAGMPNAGDKRFYMSSAPLSDVLYPDYLESTIRQKQLAAPIPLSRLVAMTTPIDGSSYVSFFLTDDADERRMRRVGEGAPVPTSTLTGGDHTIKLRKYGRRLKISYETARRMRLDKFALYISLCALQAEVDKVATIIDILINGDGNSGTSATNYNLTTMDTGAVAGSPTLHALLNWWMQWESPYACDIVLSRSAHAIEMLLCNSGSGNVPFASIAGTFGIGGVMPIGVNLGPVELGVTSSVPTETWLGVDSRWAVEMVTEIGGTLVETNKLIADQWEEIVMTEVLGFAVMDANCAKTLTLNA